MFKGLYVALVTPFTDTGLDETKLRELVQFHVESGTHGLVPCGTTGENPTFTWDEHFRIIEIAVEEAKGKLDIVPGCGTNSTWKSIENVKRAKDLGVDAAMVIAPYYNKPTQNGLYAHFEAIANAVDLPLMIYNIPGRTSVNILPETFARLVEIPQIQAVKEATGDLCQATAIRHLCGDKIAIMSGDDALTLPIMSVGGTGVVSVIGNFIPKDMIAMIDAANRGDLDEARRWNDRLFPLIQSMFYETNPIPVKEAMNILGWNLGKPRLPMQPMSPDKREKMQQVMAAYGLL
jgi:4-hydroxy-tetrahydrodipicolinate synthase